eukprot:UN09793
MTKHVEKRISFLFTSNNLNVILHPKHEPALQIQRNERHFKAMHIITKVH